MAFGRNPGGTIPNQGYDEIQTNPTTFSIMYTPTETGVETQYDLHEALFVHYSNTARTCTSNFSTESTAEVLSTLLDAAQTGHRGLQYHAKEAIPLLFSWMYTWRTENRRHMNSFNPLIGHSIMPLLNLGDFLDIPELTNDLIVYVRNEEQRGKSLDNYLSHDQMALFKDRVISPLPFQYLCNHWKCHKTTLEAGEATQASQSAEENSAFTCDSADENGTCQEPNHRFGFASFELEHWITPCPARKDRAQKLSQVLKEARVVNSRWKSQAEKDRASSYEPSPAELTCVHFHTRDKSRIQRSIRAGTDGAVDGVRWPLL